MYRKSIYLTSFFMLMMVAVPLETHAQVVNLVHNPSFEEDEVVLDDPAWEKWCTWNPAEGAGSNANIVDTESFDGTKSLRVEPVGVENWHFIVLNLPIPLDVGKAYTSSFWAKAEAARPLGAQMKATDNSISWGYTDFQLTTEWAEYTFTSEAVNAEGKLEIFCAGVEVPFWLDLVSVYEADTLSGLADVSVVDGAIISLRYGETEYVVADGELMLGTTTRWYIDAGVETLWAEGEAAPAATVSGTSNPKDGDVGSKADNFLFTLNGSTNISSIDGIDFQETIFPFLTDTFFLFERGGNDKGTWQAILADGSLGAEVAFDKASAGGPYADTGVSVNGQNAYGVVFKTSVPVQGVRITASGHDTLSISTPTGAEPVEPEPTIIVEAGGDIAAANAGAAAGDIIGIAAGTYAITEAIEIKDGVTYRGAGSGQTIIDCGGVTRAFVGWGDRSQNDDLPYSETGYPANTSGPKDWAIKGLSIINGAADDVGKSVQRAGDPAIEPPLTANVVLDPSKSTNGGGILLENYAEGTLIDVAFENCNALATGVDTTDPNLPTTYLGSGGAVHMGWATANITDCSFTGNNASNDGGAVSASNPNLENWDLSIENSTFTNNRSRDDGGAIVAVRRNLSVINCVGDGNKTGLDPDTMADNASGDPDGGFLYITGAGKVSETSYTDDTPPLEMTNYGGVVTVAGCTITNGEGRRGGGIRSNSAAQLFVTDTSFTDCSAIVDDGGAIFANSPSPFNPAALDPNDPDVPVGEPGVYIDGVTIDGSIAADDGGGINIDNWGLTSGTNYIEFPKVVISNSVVKNCRAGGPAPDDGNRDGGGIRVNNQLNLTIINTLVENCTAGRHAGGIMIDGVCDSVVMDRVRVSGCSNDDIEGEGGDGVALNMDEDDNAVVVLTNCIFDNNINMQDDGVVRIDADILTIANCTFVGNTTKDKGILYFGTGRDDPLVVTNKAVNNLFVNNDSSPGSDNTINWNKDNNNNITLNNGFFGTVLDGDSEIEDTADADMGLTGNFILSADPLVDTAGGDYHLVAGAEAIDAGTPEDAPDHDFDGATRPQGAAHDVGAYEASAN